MPKLIDLTGQSFGRLTVISRAQNNKDGRAMWLCRCSCGNQVVVLGKCLRNGHTKSCGCLNKDIVSEQCLVDRTGEQFGRLTVIARASDYIAPNKKRHVRWLCRCECGNEVVVDVCGLVRGTTKSCGCLRKETRGNLKYGGCHDRLYRVFSNMKYRCYNTKSDHFKYYGGRGIKVCDEWKNDYAAFKRWALSSGYDENANRGDCTIDRIDVNGNYEPNNCRWVDMTVQSRNRRNVINK